MAEAATKLPVNTESSSKPPAGAPEWRPFASLRREVDRLFEDFDRGFLRSPFPATPGWLRDLTLAPAQARRVSTPVRAVGEVDRERDPSAAQLRIPSVAFRFLRDHLAQGPVLVQVPMSGFSGALSCARGARRGPRRRSARGTA